MFIITADTLSNQNALELRQVPRRFLGRVFVWPRAEGDWRLKARLIFEVELLRYFAALSPFAVAALIWQDSALAISQAPLLMLLVVYAVEMRFLRVAKAARGSILPQVDCDRALDLFAVRGRQLLTRIAAARRMAEGTLTLVVEQSDLARIAPLTLVSVQWSEGPEILKLTKDERDLIRSTLFDAPLTEAQMHKLTLARNETIHSVALELRTIPAHARMAALTGIA